MESASRYEIVDTIATGDFATVYRARDRELGREVAIKLIHQQFLTDQQQLARYWQEAQLLASLQHPNILTIYDIVRPRGWLILELMRGSLKPTAGGGPIDLDFLRVALAGCLNALHFLHTNGVIHGDVKPSNMLVDPQNRVKLGDFGLARRATSEEGSLLKGTTKYMAPELVSKELGAVGPASDLYSLGFSAYELMCGSRFEELFPALGAFGRDKQIAWMMWHAAPDRKVPEINRVLEGVPEDHARVVQRHVVKDQARRYQSARDVLRDLKTDTSAIDQPPEEEDAQAEAARALAARKKRRLRFAAIGAMAFSLVLCVAMLLPKKPPPAPVGPPEPTRGVVTNVYPDEWRLAITSSTDGSASEIRFKRYDRFFINDKSHLLRDLQPHDQVVIKKVRDSSGRLIQEIYAYRPEVHKGRIKAIEADEGQFTLTIEEGDDQGKQLTVSVRTDLKIIFNGKEEIAGQPVGLADLHLGDRVLVHHIGEETGRAATELSVLRVVTDEGIFSKIDEKTGKIVVALGTAEGGRKLVLPPAPNCDVTINNRRSIGGRLLEPKDLRPGDKVSLAHDVQVVRIDAYRVLRTAGVIRKVQYGNRMIDVVLEGQSTPTTCIIGPQCKIILGGQRVELSDLRAGDVVEIIHDTPDAANPKVITLSASRPADTTRWAILVAIQDYEDRALSRLDCPVPDAKLLRDVLVKRYRVPPEQALLLTDTSLVRLEQGIAERLQNIGSDGRLLLYFASHAYADQQGTVYLAPKNFDFKRKSTTGLPLEWLVDRLEQCAAKEKLLLLDCSHAGEGIDLASQPSTAEMMQTLKAPPGWAPLRTVTAVASCAAGQRGRLRPDKHHGVFAYYLAEGYSGRADKNRDNRLEPTELFEFLKLAMASEVGDAQTPVLFLPDDRPPRLNEDARKAIRRLAAYLRQDKINLGAAGRQYAAAVELSGKELEPRLLWGLLLLKARQRDEAFKHLEELKIDNPRLLLPLQAMAWLRFQKRTYKSATAELLELVSHIPKPKKPTEAYTKQAQQIFYWTGQLRGFASAAVPSAWRPPQETLAKLDAAVASHGDDAQGRYEAGRAKSRAIVADFERRIAGALAEAAIAKLKVERRRLVHYAAFPFDQTTRQILAGLDQ